MGFAHPQSCGNKRPQDNLNTKATSGAGLPPSSAGAFLFATDHKRVPRVGLLGDPPDPETRPERLRPSPGGPCPSVSRGSHARAQLRGGGRGTYLAASPWICPVCLFRPFFFFFLVFFFACVCSFVYDAYVSCLSRLTACRRCFVLRHHIPKPCKPAVTGPVVLR